ncbi:hypothetical protein ABFS83_13G058100 [Erythranthe nasuta]
MSCILQFYGKQNRRFNNLWFIKYNTWWEYNVPKNVPYIGGQSGGNHFVTEGFSNWKINEKLSTHARGPNSAHNEVWRKCADLMNQSQHIEAVFHKQSDQEKTRYKMHVNTSIEVARYLSTQGLEFCGHNESESSANPRNFIQHVKTFGQINPDIKEVTLNSAPLKHKMICSYIQNDIGGSAFCLMVDEASNISMKEQMTLVIRCGLSVSKLRGKCYDGASNMREPCTYYIPCFAHQLQLVLVAIAKKHVRDKQYEKITEALNIGEISSGRGLNQETNLMLFSIGARWASLEFDQQFSFQTGIEFNGLNEIRNLARKIIETRRNKVYHLVYFILTLALTLPVATAIVKRVFSAMNIVKSRLRSQMNDKWLSDDLLVFIERDNCAGTDNDTDMNNFQNMKIRKAQL